MNSLIYRILYKYLDYKGFVQRETLIRITFDVFPFVERL